MPIGDVCVREVVTATAETTIRDAAKLMRENHVGDLVIMDRRKGRRVPVGIITDRDIVMAIVALELDQSVFSVGDIPTRKLETVREDEGIFETIQQMRSAGVRRIPVVTAEGSLVGIVSVDDLIQLLAEEMMDLAKLISREQIKEVSARR